MSEKPGPLVAVIAFLPASEAPMQAAIEPISSSIWMNLPPTLGSSSAQSSAISVEGVIGIASVEFEAGRQGADRAGLVALHQLGAG